ncbi:MAG: phosphotransferase, partial [Candidatus Limnocylindrales bacterium]
MVAEGTAAGLADVLRDAFGWSEAIAVAPGPRGATARIWKVTRGRDRYALKEGRGKPPSPEAIAGEVAFVEQAASAGVRVPRPHADQAGRWVVPGPDDSWLRLYDWVDVHPVDLTAASTPRAVGELFARLHRGSAPMPAEPDGSAPDPWYERPPAIAELAAATVADAPWSDRLSRRVAGLPAVLQVVAPSDPRRLVRCHRDLHPGNVLEDASGALVVIDQDDLGPAEPARELARALFDWWSDP